jgi:hypothetical protein
MVPQKWNAMITPVHRMILNGNSETIVQHYVESKFEPLFALRHLHRAKREHNPRYKWLDATIAAELAIKEFLMIKSKEPTVMALLLHMPSPPLAILYGSILQALTGQKSPRLDAIDKGNATRNKLIHRPVECQITSHDAEQYVQDIEIAIYHLLSLLCPNDPVIQEQFKSCQSTSHVASGFVRRKPHSLKGDELIGTVTGKGFNADINIQRRRRTEAKVH